MEIADTPVTGKRRPGRKFLLLAGLAVMSLSAGQMSLAIFTDQETVPATFSTGSIILDDVKIDALTLTTSAMMPGDTVTDDVVVENDGSSQLLTISGGSTPTSAITAPGKSNSPNRLPKASVAARSGMSTTTRDIRVARR